MTLHPIAKKQNTPDKPVIKELLCYSSIGSLWYVRINHPGQHQIAFHSDKDFSKESTDTIAPFLTNVGVDTTFISSS